ncbi:hypothetical protein H9X54_001015, partial [Flavobacterium macrobrachii]
NKFTDTNNCGVKVFFPCMSKFKKNQIYLQGFVYLSCATRTLYLCQAGLTCNPTFFLSLFRSVSGRESGFESPSRKQILTLCAISQKCTMIKPNNENNI